MPGTGPIKGIPSPVVSNAPDQRNSMSRLAAGHSAASFCASRLALAGIRRSRSSGSTTRSLSSPPMMIRPVGGPRAMIIPAVFPDQYAVFPNSLRLWHGRNRPARRDLLYVRTDDAGHDVAGCQDQPSRLDFMAIHHQRAYRFRCGVEFGRLGLEQARAARDRDSEQSLRQQYRVGVGCARRDDRTGPDNPEDVQQPCMIQEFAG